MDKSKPVDFRAVLAEVYETLQAANGNPAGPIRDTIWMLDTNETLFDFIATALEASQS